MEIHYCKLMECNNPRIEEEPNKKHARLTHNLRTPLLSAAFWKILKINVTRESTINMKNYLSRCNCIRLEKHLRAEFTNDQVRDL
jgi:hypothetical protein